MKEKELKSKRITLRFRPSELEIVRKLAKKYETGVAELFSVLVSEDIAKSLIKKS